MGGVKNPAFPVRFTLRRSARSPGRGKTPEQPTDTHDSRGDAALGWAGPRCGWQGGENGREAVARDRRGPCGRSILRLEAGGRGKPRLERATRSLHTPAKDARVPQDGPKTVEKPPSPASPKDSAQVVARRKEERRPAELQKADRLLIPGWRTGAGKGEEGRGGGGTRLFPPSARRAKTSPRRTASGGSPQGACTLLGGLREKGAPATGGPAAAEGEAAV